MLAPQCGSPAGDGGRAGRSKASMTSGFAALRALTPAAVLTVPVRLSQRESKGARVHSPVPTI